MTAHGSIKGTTRMPSPQPGSRFRCQSCGVVCTFNLSAGKPKPTECRPCSAMGMKDFKPARRTQ